MLEFEGELLNAAKAYCLNKDISGSNFLFGVAILLVDTALVYKISKANLANFLIEVYNLAEALHTKADTMEGPEDGTKRTIN